MSTKTSIKRIALVAVSALGLGLVSVIPANAGESLSSVVTEVTPTRAAATMNLNTNNLMTVTIKHGLVATAADTITIRGAVITKPSAAVTTLATPTVRANVTATAGTRSAATFATTGSSASVAVCKETVANDGTDMAKSTSADIVGASGIAICTVNFQADTAGSYTLRFWHDSSANGAQDAGETFGDVSVTVTKAATTDFGNSADTTASTDGTIVGTIVPSVGVTVVETSGRVGQMVGFAPNFKIKRNAGATANDQSAALSGRSANLNYSVVNAAGTAVSVVDAKVSGVASTEQYVAGSGTLTATSATASITTASPIVGSTVYFAAATAGTYTITVWHDQNRDDLVSVGEASTTSSVVIAADALPSITFTKYGSNTTAAQSADGLWGQLVKVSLRNGTTPWQLAGNESLVLTSAASTTDFLAYTTWTSGTAAFTDAAANVSTLTLTSANFNGNGDAWINVGDTTVAGGTFSVSAVVNGGTANGATGSFTITTIDTDTATPSATAYTLVNSNAVTATDANRYLGTYSSTADSVLAQSEGGNWYVKPGVATTVTAKVNAGTGTYKLYNGLVTDTLGLITGVVGAKYNVNALTAIASTGLTAASTASLSVAVPATTATLATETTVATMVIDANTDITVTIKTQTAAVDSVSTDPSDLAGDYSLRAAAASTNKFTAYVWDQFGNAVPGAACTSAVTGRNATTVASSYVSDANGAVSHTVVDTYTGTLLNSDSLVFTCSGQTSTVTINYATYNPASTVTITGGASADVAPTVTYNYITTAVAGADATTVKMTATVKDANGATLPAGIKVTWSISGIANAAILKDSTTGYDWTTSYTDSNGQAVTYVYAWGTGDVSVKATAGTVTSATAGTIHFANAAADARVLSATTEGGVVKAKVVDRYGNPVSGVSVTATRVSGTGYFGGSGASSAAAETGTDGTVDFVIQGGSAVVDVKTTTLNAGQTSSASGYVGATAVTATGVGASFAPAGVQSVTGIEVAGSTSASDALDAANEATDAANAATDAANAAAEAADAATAAAQDAQAAVAELATKVASLIAGIKAQITTLTNLVIKIQKKVRA